MSIETQLVTFENWTLRVRPPLEQGRRILLMLHGWQGDENSMWIFARNLPADYWIVAPRAPHPAREGGYTWRTPVSGGWPTIETLRPSVEALLGLLGAWAPANGLEAASLDVIGFSQGAAMSFSLAVLHPERVQKLGILAGFAPEGTEPLLSPGQFSGKHFFVAHGTRDERVPIEQARRSIALLEGAGAQVSYCESDVGHKLGIDCLRGLEGYLAG